MTDIEHMKECRGKLKKVLYKKDRNHMDVTTGHATFDRQVLGVMTGNVWGLTQWSGFVRARTDNGETLVGDRVYPFGNLQEYDLKQFKGTGSDRVKRFIRKEIGDDVKAIVYKIRHWRGDNEVVHGWLVTDSDYRHIKTFVCGPTCKSSLVMETMKPYLSWTGH